MLHSRFREEISMMKTVFRTGLLPLLAFAAVCVAYLSSASVVGLALFLPAILVACVAFGYSVACQETPTVPVILVTACTALLAWLTHDVSGALLLLTLFVPVGLAVGITLHRKKPVNSAALLVVYLALFLFAATFAAFVVEASDSGFSVAQATDVLKAQVRPIFDQYYDLLNEQMNTANPVVDYRPLLALGKDGFAEQMGVQTLQVLAAWLPTLLLAVTAGCYYLCGVLLRRRGISDAATPFDRIRIEKSTAIVYLLSVVAGLVTLLFTDMPLWIQIVVLLAENALQTVFFAEGLSVVVYYMKNVRCASAGAVRTLVVFILLFAVVLFLLMGSDLILLVLSGLGVLDAFSDLRKRFGEGGKI